MDNIGLLGALYIIVNIFFFYLAIVPFSTFLILIFTLIIFVRNNRDLIDRKWVFAVVGTFVGFILNLVTLVILLLIDVTVFDSGLRAPFIIYTNLSISDFSTLHSLLLYWFSSFHYFIFLLALILFFWRVLKILTKKFFTKTNVQG
jgi:hypothetical protein